MNSSTRRTALTAAMAAILFAAGAPQVMADQGAAKPQQLAWGYGMGPGMMGGYGGYGMGPGMMGGYGYGMGPGMMGYYGMNPAMRGAYGPGPGMMAGVQSNWSLDLTPEQEAKIGKIQVETRQKQLDIMGQMWGEMAKLRGLYTSQTRDDKAVNSAISTITSLRQQMFENMVTARKQVDTLLTKEQQEKLRGFWPMASAPAAASKPAK